MISINMHSRSGLPSITASTLGTLNAPLNIKMRDRDGTVSEVFIFTENQDYADKLMEAINAVTEEFAASGAFENFFEDA